MKKYLLCLICLMLLPALAMAEVPDELLHDAVMTLTWPDEGGECWVEGHVVLGEENKGDTTEVYAQVYYQNYGFMDGVFTDTGGGGIGAVTMVFTNTPDGYALKEIIRPEDGTEYNASLRRMMPESCIRKMNSEGDANRVEMERQMNEQAQAYLDAIGRTETIQDWRERDMQLSGMLVAASNFMSNVDRNYPLWVTSHERVEDGVRYVYTRKWEPQETLPDGQTGVLVLTKTLYDDGNLVETITAGVETDQLTITLADEKGSITYAFAFNGHTYQQPVITSVGECSVDQSGIWADISRLPD